jgi:hypothetical protein
MLFASSFGLAVFYCTSNSRTARENYVSVSPSERLRYFEERRPATVFRTYEELAIHGKARERVLRNRAGTPA